MPKSVLSLSIVLHPATLTLLVLLVSIGIYLAQAGGDPLALIQVGTRYGAHDPNGSEGYDGQFIYFVACDPRPAVVASHLDVPAYRYQRILLPLLARLAALGRLSAIPWALLALGIFSHTIGTWAVAELLADWGVRRAYALVYGLWMGFLLAVRVALPEPLAMGLIALALLAAGRGRHKIAWCLYGLALLAKETAIVFVAAHAAVLLIQRDWKKLIGLSVITLLPYALFQGWLWLTFSQPGLASGGAMATPFEIIPLMGLWRIAPYSPTMLAVWLVVFGPPIVAPALWGLWAGLRALSRGENSVLTLNLLLNALSIISLPFSTFREPAGLLRFGGGLVLAGLLFAAHYRQRRALTYFSTFWLAMNVFLLKG